MSTLLVLIIVTALIMCCDVSDLTLSEHATDLLYADDDFQENEVSSEDKIFGDSTVTQQINTEDLVDFDAAKQAEEALDRIYNGGK